MKQRGNSIRELLEKVSNSNSGRLVSLKQMKEIIKSFLKSRESYIPGGLAPYFMGYSGYGKSSTVKEAARELAEEEGRRIVVVDLRLSNYRDVVDFVGEKVPTPYGRVVSYYPEALVNLEVQIELFLEEKGLIAELEEFRNKINEFEERFARGDRTALIKRSKFVKEFCKKHDIVVLYFFDEINLMPDKFNALFYGLLSDGILGVYEVPEGLVVFASNVTEEVRLSGADILDAFAARQEQFYVLPELEEYLEYGEKSGAYHEAVIAFMRLNPHYFGEYQRDADNRKSEVSPRSFEKATKLLKIFGNNIELLKASLAGLWPEHIAEAFVNFYVKNYLEVYKRIMSKAAEFKRTGVISPIDTGDDLDTISVSLATIIAHLNSRLKALSDKPSEEGIALLSVYIASFIHMNGKLLLLQEKEGKNLAIASEFLSTFMQSYLSGIGTRHKLLSSETYEAMANYIERLKGKGRLSIKDIEGFLSLPGVLESIQNDGIHSPPIMALIKLMNEANAIERTPAIEKGIKEMRKGLEEVYGMYNKGPKR